MFLIHNSPDQAPLLAAAIVGACRSSTGWAAPAQPAVLQTLFQNLLGFNADFDEISPTEPSAVLAALPEASQRRELIELMVTMEMLCSPIPPVLQASVDQWANELGVEDRVLLLARDLFRQSLARATADFYRLNWIGEADPQADPKFQSLLEHYGATAYALTFEPDQKESERWRQLECYPDGSLGSELWKFYRKRNFKLPGEVGAANAALAQHDWVHVIADYDTTAIGELEVTAFMASASRAPGAMLGFVGAVSLYETGLLRSVVTHSYSRTLSDGDGVERVAAAIRKGARCRVDPLVGVDYFAIASSPLVAVRQAWGLDTDKD